MRIGRGWRDEIGMWVWTERNDGEDGGGLRREKRRGERR